MKVLTRFVLIFSFKYEHVITGYFGCFGKSANKKRRGIKGSGFNDRRSEVTVCYRNRKKCLAVEGIRV